MRRARMQEPGPDGVRRTRWAIVRNTYRELEDTTMKTWFDWFPEEVFGELVKGDKAHRIVTAGADGYPVHAEVLFRALDKPSDIKKVLSLEVTGAWVNEARELPRGLIQALRERCGRYPAKRDQVLATLYEQREQIKQTIHELTGLSAAPQIPTRPWAPNDSRRARARYGSSGASAGSKPTRVISCASRRRSSHRASASEP